MKRTLTILVLCVLSLDVCAQDQHVIDSIMPLIKHDGSQNDMEIFYELGFQYGSNDLRLSITYLDSTAAIAYKVGDSLKVVKAGRLKAQALRYHGRQIEALKILEKLLPIATRLGFTTEAGFILKTTAVTHIHMARYDKGMEFNLRALELWRKEKDSVEIADILNNIGVIHYKIENYDRAIDYYSQSLAIAEHGKFPGFRRLAQLLYANIGTAYIKTKDFAKGREWIERGIANCSERCDAEVLTNVEFGLGYLYYHQKDFKKAGGHFERSYNNSRLSGDTRFEAENLNYLAHVARVGGDLDSAYRCLATSQHLCIEGSFRNLLAVNYYQLSQLYKDLKQNDKASLFLEKYIELNDSIHSGTIRNRIAVMQIEFDEKEHSLELDHQKALLAKQRTQKVLTTVIGVLSVLLAIGLFLLLRSKRRANYLLDKRVAERTQELEMNKAALQRAYDEQLALVTKTSQSIKSALATQKGLTESIAKIEHSTEIDLKTTAQAIESELNGLADELSAKNFTTRSNPESE